MDTLLRVARQNALLIGLTVFVVVLFLLLFRNGAAGPRVANDLWTFDRWSDFIVATDFSLSEWFGRMPHPERLYLVPMSLMAVLKVYAGEAWQHVFFWLNLLWTGLIMTMLCSAARMLNVSWLAIAAALPLLLISSGFMFWPQHVLTDTLFAFLIMAGVWWSVFMLTRAEASLTHRVAQTGVAVALLLLVLFGRPTSLTYTLAFLVFCLALVLRVDRLRPWQIGSGFAAVCCLVAVGYGVLMLLYINTNWIDRSRELAFLANYATQGVIVWGRPESFITHAGDWSGFAQVYLLRFVTFWSPYASSFSTAHLLANTAITLVFAAATLAWLVTGRSLSRAAARTVLLCLLLAFAGAAFHGLLFIDYDWRYRFPVIAPLLLVAMVMLNHVGQRLLPPRWHGMQA